MPEPLMDIDDLAAYLKRPKSWVYDNHGERGERIPVIKKGQGLRFRRAAVDRWLEG